MNANEVMEFAKELGREAGRMAMRSFRSTVAIEKVSPDGRDLVTQADKDIEAFLTRRILDAYPTHQILGEENGVVSRSHSPDPITWVLDPIDGTFNFAAGIPLFGVCIAVCVQGEAEVGVVELPALGETYYAARGTGAFRNGARLAVDADATVRTALIDFCGRDLFSAFERMGKAGFDRRLPRLTGCVALGTAYVAAGSLGALIHTSVNPWDMAAGLVLVEEAGGVVSDFAGATVFPKYLDMYLDGQGDKFCCLVTTPGLHPALLELVKGVSAHALGGSANVETAIRKGRGCP